MKREKYTIKNRPCRHYARDVRDGTAVTTRTLCAGQSSAQCSLLLPSISCSTVCGRGRARAYIAANFN